MRDNGPLNGKEIVLRDDQLIVSRTDLQGRIVYANADFIEINGFSEDGLIGQPQSGSSRIFLLNARPSNRCATRRRWPKPRCG